MKEKTQRDIRYGSRKFSFQLMVCCGHIVDVRFICFHSDFYIYLIKIYNIRRVVTWGSQGL